MNHAHRKFQNPPALSHDTVAEAIERAILDRQEESTAIEALVGVALADTDRAFIEHCCLKVGNHPAVSAWLRGIAALCLGHTARRFGRLSPEAIQLAGALAARAQHDPSDVATNALDGFSDVTWHLRRYKAKWRRGRYRLWPSWDSAAVQRAIQPTETCS